MPATLFREDGSPLSLLAHYLVDDCGLSLKDSSTKVHRSYRAFWGAYRKLPKKGWIRLADTPHRIPLGTFSQKLSIMEATVLYLKSASHLTLHQIAVLLERDDRTVWTHLHRAMQKGGAS